MTTWSGDEAPILRVEADETVSSGPLRSELRGVLVLAEDHAEVEQRTAGIVDQRPIRPGARVFVLVVIIGAEVGPAPHQFTDVLPDQCGWRDALASHELSIEILEGHASRRIVDRARPLPDSQVVTHGRIVLGVTDNLTKRAG